MQSHKVCALSPPSALCMLLTVTLLLLMSLSASAQAGLWYQLCQDPHHHHYFILALLDGMNLLQVHVSSWALCQHLPATARVSAHACTFICVLLLHSKSWFGKFFPVQPRFLLQVLEIKCTLHHIPVVLPEMLSGALSGCCVLHPAPSRSTFCAASMSWPCSGSCSLFITLTETLSS